MNTTGIEIDFQSTPRLWMASREGACHCQECHPPVGLGKTPIEALAHLLEQELEAELSGDKPQLHGL